MNNKLKPCPFCGSKAKLSPDWNPLRRRELYTVECTKEDCNALINHMELTPEMAIEKWNRRSKK